MYSHKDLYSSMKPTMLNKPEVLASQNCQSMAKIQQNGINSFKDMLWEDYIYIVLQYVKCTHNSYLSLLAS